MTRKMGLFHHCTGGKRWLTDVRPCPVDGRGARNKNDKILSENNMYNETLRTKPIRQPRRATAETPPKRNPYGMRPTHPSPVINFRLQPNVTVSRSSIHTSPIMAGESIVEMLLRARKDDLNFVSYRKRMGRRTCELSVEEYFTGISTGFL